MKRRKFGIKWVSSICLLAVFWMSVEQFIPEKCRISVSKVLQRIPRSFWQYNTISKRERGVYKTTMRCLCDLQERNLKFFGKIKENISEPINFSKFRWPLDIDLVTKIAEHKNQNDKEPTNDILYPFVYSFLINPTHKCKSENMKELYLLFLVKSEFRNREKRDMIRKTWGNETFLKFHRTRTVFMIGKPKHHNEVDGIADEMSQHDDLVQVNIVDYYYNNTLKTIAMVNWVVKYCHAKYVMFVDDDILVFPEVLVTLLDLLPASHRKHLYMGHIFERSIPKRDPSNKWFADLTEYPYNFYPTFVAAGSTVFSLDALLDFQIAMLYTKPFRLDDVYLGIIAKRLKLLARGVYQFQNKKLLRGDEELEDMICGHGYSPEELERTWNRTRFIRDHRHFSLKIIKEDHLKYFLKRNDLN